MKRKFAGTLLYLAVAAVLVWVAGCTRPMSTGPIPKPQSAQSVPASPTPEAIPTTVLGTVVAGATATSAATTPESNVPTPTTAAATPVPPTATPVVAPTAAPSGGGTSYTVMPGEWLYSIARKFGISPYTLAQVNHIVAPYTLYPGQVLTIPSGSVAPTPVPGTTPGTYVVQRGDTIYSIARKLGKTPAAIINANNLANPNFIFPGQVLKIP